VDDNPGEIAAVAQELPQVHVLHAGADAGLTARALAYYPGLWAWAAGETDALRVADLRAAEERAKLQAEAADPEEYLRGLQVRLTFALDPRGQLARLHEMSQKTNQFNLSLRRYREGDLAHCLGAEDCRVVSVRLSDRLSESGVIGLVVGRRDGDALVVEELCISCRALGRNLEDLMVEEAVRRMLTDLPAGRVEVAYRSGPRNGPGRQWLAGLLGQPLGQAEGRAALPAEFGRVARTGSPVVIRWGEGDEA
jgi:FkbH-like protein